MYEKVYLKNESGNLLLDVSQANSSNKVVIMLHGVTGSSKDNYMLDMAGASIENDISVVAYNHYAPRNEKDLRLMDMSLDKHLDEVI